MVKQSPVTSMKLQIADAIPYCPERTRHTLDDVLRVIGVESTDYDQIDIIMAALIQLIKDGIFIFTRTQSRFAIARIS